MSVPEDIEAKKAQASAWFAALQGRIIDAFETLESEAPAALYPGEPARFVKKPWQRTDASGADGGGGTMALMHGRLFEKVGVHVSAVHGAFAPEFAKDIPGASEDRASGPPASR